MAGSRASGVRPLRVGAVLSLSGRFARFGTQAAHGLGSWLDLTDGVDVVLDDDTGDPGVLRERLHALAARCDLVLGPYSTVLMRAAADVATADDLLVWNHGGSGDDVAAAAPGHVVSVPSPTSRYAEPFVRHLADLREPAPLVLAEGRGRFARQVVAGAERHAERLGVPTNRAEPGALPEQAQPWDFFTAGTFEEDIAQVAAVRTAARRPRTIGAVAAGVREFGQAVPDSDGVIGVAQWFPGLGRAGGIGAGEIGAAEIGAAEIGAAEIGPSERDFLDAYESRTGTTPDYPAVQAAAAAALAVHCAQEAGGLARDGLWAVATQLRASTMFGEFAVDACDGSQVGHRMRLVRWTRGRLTAA